MACIYIYNDLATGRELLRVRDEDNQLSVPEVGEKIKVERMRYQVESVYVSESLCGAAMPVEYRILVLQLEGYSKAAGA
jgi:hypothetical protein